MMKQKTTLLLPAAIVPALLAAAFLTTRGDQEATLQPETIVTPAAAPDLAGLRALKTRIYYPEKPGDRRKPALEQQALEQLLSDYEG